MRFDSSILESKYYTSINSFSYEKKLMLEDNENLISEFKQKIFDFYDIENVYFHESFLEKNKGSNVALYVEMSRKDFEDFINIREEFLEENLDIVVLVDDLCYKFSYDSKILEVNKPEFKLVVK